MRLALGLIVACIAALLPTQTAMADELGVKIVSAPADVQAGDEIAITVQTDPGASCEGAVEWKAMRGYGHSSVNLARRTANNEGKVTWSWKIGQGPAARGQIVVTCQAGDKSGKASTSLMRR